MNHPDFIWSKTKTMFPIRLFRIISRLKDKPICGKYTLNYTNVLGTYGIFKQIIPEKHYAETTPKIKEAFMYIIYI